MQVHVFAPPCPVCEENGRPECYKSKAEGGCGCILSTEQQASREAEERRWKEQAEAEVGAHSTPMEIREAIRPEKQATQDTSVDSA